MRWLFDDANSAIALVDAPMSDDVATISAMHRPAFYAVAVGPWNMTKIEDLDAL
jgi:hypothetical protein